MGRQVIMPRAGTALVLTGLVVGSMLGLAGCGGGSGVTLPTRTSTISRPTSSAAESSSEAGPSAPALPTRTSEAPAQTSSEAPSPPETSTEAPSPPETRTVTTTATKTSIATATVTQTAVAAPTPTPTASTTSPATTTTSGGLPVWAWILIIAVIAAALGAWLFTRSRRAAATGWDTDAAALGTDTRAVTDTRLPAVLTSETPGERALSWPPVRASMVSLVGRWDQLVQSAPDDPRRDQSGRVAGLLQELVTAVDAENEALATGRNWTLLRPRVDDARRALSAALAGGPQPPGGPSGPPYGGPSGPPGAPPQGPYNPPPTGPYEPPPTQPLPPSGPYQPPPGGPYEPPPSGPSRPPY